MLQRAVALALLAATCMAQEPLLRSKADLVLVPVAITVSEMFSDRIGVGPETISHRLGNDRRRLSTPYVFFCKLASPMQMNTKRLEIAWRYAVRVHADA